jgi:hypothetical protein
MFLSILIDVFWLNTFRLVFNQNQSTLIHLNPMNNFFILEITKPV